MDSPSGIIPTAVYERSQVCEVLGIGDTKLRELVADGRLKRMTFSGRWRFFGEELIRLCRESSRLPSMPVPVHLVDPHAKADL